MKKWELGKSKYIASIYKDISQNLSELGLTVDCPPANVEHTQVNFLELLTKPASIVKHDIIKIGHGKLCIAIVQVFVNLKMGKISLVWCLFFIYAHDLKICEYLLKHIPDTHCFLKNRNTEEIILHEIFIFSKFCQEWINSTCIMISSSPCFTLVKD